MYVSINHNASMLVFNLLRPSGSRKRPWLQPPLVKIYCFDSLKTHRCEVLIQSSVDLLFTKHPGRNACGIWIKILANPFNKTGWKCFQNVGHSVLWCCMSNGMILHHLMGYCNEAQIRPLHSATEHAPTFLIKWVLSNWKVSISFRAKVS